jgi:antitoxin component YwqK of YwqJK toxin-antitoxin module
VRTQVLAVAIVTACSSPPRSTGSQSAAPSDAAVATAPSAVPPDAGPPPELDCPAGASIVRGSAGDRTIACVRPDGVRDGPFVVRFPDGTVQVRGGHAAGRLDGDWQRFHPDGQLAEAGGYADGKKDGAWRQLAPDGTEVATYTMQAGTGTEVIAWDDGSPRRETGWKDGVRHGRARVWDPGEQLLADETWVDGALDGDRVLGHKNGARVVERWARGVRTGARQLWWKQTPLIDEAYDADGRRHRDNLTRRDKRRKREEGSWAHGARDGDWRWYGLSGKLEREGRYRGGLLDGEIVVYGSGGAERDRYAMKRGTGTSVELHKNGKRAARVAWKDGLRQGASTRWWPNGKLAETGEHDAGERHGDWKSQWPDGEVRAESGWRHGVLHGDVTRRRGDTVETEATFANGRRHGPFVERFADGAVILIGHFRDGAPDGTWTQYRKDGTVVLRATWTDGQLDTVDIPTD